MGADPGTDAYASPVTGWIVSTGATNRSEFEAAVERAATTFDATTYPDGSLNTTIKDAWLINPGGAGDYASGNWTINGVVRANSNGGSQDGRLYYRLFKADADGTNATEITSAAQQGALLTNVSTSADFNSSVTFNPGAFSVTASQRVFVQLAWERTGAGGMSTSDINFRIGTNSTRVVTSDFTATSQNFTADVNETVSLSESVGALFGAVAGTSETVTLSESLAARHAAIAATPETVALSESLAALFAAAADVNEPLSLAESIAAGLLLTADVNETVALSESLASVLGGIVTAEETVALGETVTTAFAALAAIVESLALAEQLAAGLVLTADVAETVSLSEATAAAYAAITAPSETVEVIEQLGSAWSTIVPLVDSIALAESINVPSSSTTQDLTGAEARILTEGYSTGSILADTYPTAKVNED